MTNKPYTGECKDCYQHVLSPECDGHGIRVGEPCPFGKPMEQKNEPTTGEIVRALRCSADDDSFCKKCQYGYALGSAFLCDRGRMNQNASDRLESQERTIAEKDAEIEKLKSDRCMILGAVTETNVCVGNLIERLTARAESAERERDAVIADLDALKDSGFCNSCVGCNAPHSESITYCTDWKRRGPQPQEGVKE